MQTESSPRSERVVQAVAVGLLIAAPALLCFRGLASCAMDPDVGWQIQTGAWILHHHALPHTDPFSRTEAGAHWQAYSWLFDLILLKLYAWFNLDGLVALTAAMAVAITAALYRLVSRAQPDFLASALLTAVAVTCILRNFTPRSWLFSILFFVLQLDILFAFRRTRQARVLLWLPAIYILWASLHIQFVDGLVVLCIAALEPLLARWAKWGDEPRTSRPLLITLGACVVAPVLNPYGADIYADAWTMGSQTGVLTTVKEMHALAFRSPADYLLLFFGLAATALLFRRGRPAPFETLLLAMAFVLSFRSQRDAWILAAVSAAIIAGRLRAAGERPPKPSSWTIPVSLATIAAVTAAGWVGLDVRNSRLRAFQAKTFPVQAVKVIQQRHYVGPLFNNYGWGGYLIWKLRWPVSIDGRAGLYGDKLINRSLSTWSGGPDWASNPALESAGLVIAPVDTALTQLLRLDPRFRIVYADKVAVVFQAQKPAPTSATARPASAQ